MSSQEKMNKAFTELFLLSLIVIVANINGQCPVSGCSPNHCFCGPQSVNFPREPDQLWYIKSTSYDLSKDGCIANGKNIICPFDKATNAGTGCLAISINGKFTWECKYLKPIPLPLVDITGQVIASDGVHLVAYDASGNPLSKPVYLFPEEGSLFDLVITDNGMFVMIYKCGFIAATDTNGIPWASRWLNDSYNSVTGTFVPLATPAVVGHRMYLPTAFWPHDNTELNHPDDEFILRFYAIDITTAQVERIRVAWTYTVKVTGYLTTLEDNFKDCKLVPPPPLIRQEVSAIPIKPIGHVMAIRNTIILTLNFLSTTGNYRYLSIGLNDTGTNFRENFYTDATNVIVTSMSSLSFMTVGSPRSIKSYVNSFDNVLLQANVYTTNQSNPSIASTTIQFYSISIQILGSFSLETLLAPLHSIELTSDLMTLKYSPPSNETHFPPISYMYLIFGVQGEMDNIKQTFLVGVEIDTSFKERLLWKKRTPDGCSPVGQLPILTSEEGQIMLVVSTQCGVISYSL